MAFIGKSVAPVIPFTLASVVYSAGLKHGAAVVFDASNKGCKAPGGAAALGFCGFITEAQPTAGTASGDAISLQVAGIARGLLAAGATITYGAALVIAGTDGSLRAQSADDNCSVVGYSLSSFTAGSNNDPIAVLVAPFEIHRS